MASDDRRTEWRVTASSAQLPAGAGDRARRRWFEEVAFDAGDVDYAFAPDRPCSWRVDAATFGPVVVDRFRGTLTRMAQTAHHVAAHGRDHFWIGASRRGCVSVQSGGRHTVLTPGSMTLASFAEPFDARHDPFADCLSIFIPRTSLTDLVAGADDLLAVPLDRRLPSVRLLRGYLELVLSTEHVMDGDPPLAAHVARTLTDLAALSLGACRDAAEQARGRGQRAARVALAVAAIKAGFADRDVSPGRVAAGLGLSARTLQDLLHDTGRTFTQRVLELRLQKARAMLSDPGHQRQGVSEIAYAAGFNDVSYFNRCFRRRYGIAPSDLRPRAGRSRR